MIKTIRKLIYILIMALAWFIVMASLIYIEMENCLTALILLIIGAVPVFLLLFNIIPLKDLNKHEIILNIDNKKAIIYYRLVNYDVQIWGSSVLARNNLMSGNLCDIVTEKAKEALMVLFENKEVEDACRYIDKSEVILERDGLVLKFYLKGIYKD